MKEQWNKRYSGNEFVYGKQANEFLKNELPNIGKGKILFSAEGEGRNAVFAAKLGWEVWAFDISDVGKEKALKFAKQEGVELNYAITRAEEIAYAENSFDCLGCFFTHLPTEIRQSAFSRMVEALKPGGELIFEAFSKNQIDYNSGGPKSLDLLYSCKEIEELFKELTEVNVLESEVVLDEGPLHQGKAMTIRARGKK